MTGVFAFFNSRTLYVVASAGLLAACASQPGHGPDYGYGAGGPRPHYKIGSPYTIDGRTYRPEADPAYDRVGVASWYGDAFHGKPTANGEIFDKNRISAAHKTLPMPTIVRVENLENGRSIVVRVNDRGPFVDDRIIDLSHAAADELGFTARGLAKVRVTFLGDAELNALAALPGRKQATQRLARNAPPSPQPKTTPQPKPAAMPQPVSVQRDGIADILASQESNGLAALSMAPIGAETLSPRPAQSTPLEYWVELAAYESIDAFANDEVDISTLGDAQMVTSADNDGASRHALRIGPFASLEAADARRAQAKGAGFPNAVVLPTRRPG